MPFIVGDDTADFITVQDLSSYLGRDVTSDDGATFAIGAACDTVRSIAEQAFTYGTATETYDGTGTDCILLRRLPVANAGTVSVDGAAVTDYMLSDNGLLLRGTAGVLPRPTWPEGRQNVTVTYEHGYQDSSLPRDVRMVALSLASRLIVQGVAVQETVGDASVRYAGPASDLTAGEQMILAKYRVIRSG